MGITDPGVPGYLKSLVNGADAEKAYAAFLQFKDVVKNNQVSSPGPAATAQSGGAIGNAAKKLSDASYPFLKSIDWNSDLYIKPLPGVTPKNALLAVDKTIGAEQAVLWSKPTRGQRGRQGLLRVQGRCEGRTALSKDGGQRARFFFETGGILCARHLGELPACLKASRPCSVRTGYIFQSFTAAVYHTEFSCCVAVSTQDR